MESLAGRTFGPFPLQVCVAKVAEFVGATNDDAERWHDHAPPGWASACLFEVAPRLLASPELAGRSVVHGEQRFSWLGPFLVEQTVEVTGTVGRVRSRGGVVFLGFDFKVETDTVTLASGSATFLVSGDTPAAGSSDEEEEPPPEVRGNNDPLAPLGAFTPVRRSASRADLVRYAAASRDWNPIHWDHDAARAAGLPGVVAHGLLQSSWLMSAAARLRQGPAPLAEASFRFRAPLRPNVDCLVVGDIEGDTVTARLSAGDSDLVSSRLVLR